MPRIDQTVTQQPARAGQRIDRGEQTAARKLGFAVAGVEPSEQMASLARDRISTVKVAPAEQLPFKDGWFERAVMVLVIHLLDRPQAFAEAQRVLGAEGRLVVATFDPASFRTFWLTRPLRHTATSASAISARC